MLQILKAPSSTVAISFYHRLSHLVRMTQPSAIKHLAEARAVFILVVILSIILSLDCLHGEQTVHVQQNLHILVSASPNTTSKLTHSFKNYNKKYVPNRGIILVSSRGGDSLEQLDRNSIAHFAFAECFFLCTFLERVAPMNSIRPP